MVVPWPSWIAAGCPCASNFTVTPLAVVTPVTFPSLFFSTALPLAFTVLEPPLGSGCVPGWLLTRFAFAAFLLTGAPQAVFPFAGGEFPVTFEFAPDLPLAEFGVMSRTVVSFSGCAGLEAGVRLLRLFALVLVRFAFAGPPVVR